jgi:hypothetical protein
MVREIRNASLCLLVVWIAAPATLQAQAADQSAQQTTVAFSDPSRPGMLQASMVLGRIVVRGTNRKDVLVTSRDSATDNSRDRARIRVRGGAQPADDPAAAGLRRLTQPGGFNVEESDNEIEISASPMRPVDLDIEVPARTNLRLNAVTGGITVEGVEGDIEVRATNGPVQLTNVAGSVVALTTNGTLTATLSRVTADKAMSFASTNGNVDVTLPPSVRANFKLRSDQGDVYTNFDLQIASSASASSDARRNGGRYRVSVNRTINGSANGGGPEIELRTFNGNVYLRRAQ